VGEIAHLLMMYEGLTRLDENLETVPAAAESWAYNDEATQLVFQLRPDLKYSDGSLLNAKRFEISILRNID
jgi:ABC-type transport system substrate-binding protein